MGGLNTSSNSSSSEGSSQSISDYFSNALGNSTSKSVQQSKSGTSESSISKQQSQILANREQTAQNFFFPQVQSEYSRNTEGSSEFNAGMAQQANAINTSFNAAQQATNQGIQQMGLGGSQTGIEAALKASNDRARSSALAQAYNTQLQNAQSNRLSLLSMVGQTVPNATTDTAYHQTSTSSGTSNSQSTNTSVSGGTSSSYSKNSAKGEGSSYGFSLG